MVIAPFPLCERVISICVSNFFIRLSFFVLWNSGRDFFFVLFFACGLVNNKFLDLLRFEVCKENLAEASKKSFGIIEDY